MAPNRRVLGWEPSEPEGNIMQFRLTYSGLLLASRTGGDLGDVARIEQKHGIRKVFHKQLKRLWYTNPNLVPRTQHDIPGVFLTSTFNTDPHRKTYASVVERRASNWTEHGFRFVPLVTEDSGLNCRLYVLL